MLAIVIPYYKFSFFEKTLQSLVNQTNKDFSVYIGNDFSPENPEDLVESYKGKLNISYKKFDVNLGFKYLIKHWERCISMTQDEKWIMILGDDDVLENNVIEAFYEKLQDIVENSIDVIRFSTRKIDENDKAISESYNHPKIELATDFIIRKYKGNTRSSLSEYIFNCELLKIKGFKSLPLGWQSDVIAVLEISNFKRIYSICNALMYIRISNKSISGSDDYHIQKLKANSFFHRYLIDNLNRFQEEDRLFLLIKFENMFLNYKRDLKFGFKILVYYFKNFEFKKGISFLKKIILKNASRF